MIHELGNQDLLNLFNIINTLNQTNPTGNISINNTIYPVILLINQIERSFGNETLSDNQIQNALQHIGESIIDGPVLYYFSHFHGIVRIYYAHNEFHFRQYTLNINNQDAENPNFNFNIDFDDSDDIIET